VSHTTNVSTCYTNTIDSEEQEMNLASSSILYKNQKTEEDGLVLTKKNSIPEDTATVSPNGSPMDQLLLLLFTNPDTRKKWKLTTRQAEAILEDSNGMSISSILSQIDDSRDNIEHAKNSIGYIRAIMKNLAPGSKANNGAKPTRPTPPHAPPPSLEPTAAQERAVGIRTPASFAGTTRTTYGRAIAFEEEEDSCPF